jgi:hypothetical protein
MITKMKMNLADKNSIETTQPLIYSKFSYEKDIEGKTTRRIEKLEYLENNQRTLPTTITISSNHDRLKAELASRIN